jgi:hypothetical protein
LTPSDTPSAKNSTLVIAPLDPAPAVAVTVTLDPTATLAPGNGVVMKTVGNTVPLTVTFTPADVAVRPLLSSTVAEMT